MFNLIELFGIPTAHAATFAPVVTFMGKVNRYIINPIIVLLFAGALVYFLFGVFQFVLNLDDPGEREIGKAHMIWGVVGMFIMFAVFAILSLIQNTLGADPLPNIQ